eukprot:8720541-Pyramimonas_sp.AAC.1
MTPPDVSAHRAAVSGELRAAAACARAGVRALAVRLWEGGRQLAKAEGAREEAVVKAAAAEATAELLARAQVRTVIQ